MTRQNGFLADEEIQVLLQWLRWLSSELREKTSKRSSAEMLHDKRHQRLLCVFCSKYPHICDPIRICLYHGLWCWTSSPKHSLFCYSLNYSTIQFDWQQTTPQPPVIHNKSFQLQYRLIIFIARWTCETNTIIPEARYNIILKVVKLWRS